MIQLQAARITDLQSDEVKWLLAVGHSLPTIHAIKKPLGLVKSRQSLPPQPGPA